MKPIISEFEYENEFDINVVTEAEPEGNKETPIDNKKEEPKNKPNKEKQKAPSKNDNDLFGSDESGGKDSNDPFGGGSLGSNEGGNDLLGGGGDSEPDYSLTDIGKVYVLKKVYTSLDTLLSYCDTIQKLKYNKKIDKVREDLIQSKELFVLLSSNIDKYMDKLDTIINEYRKIVNKISSFLYEYAKDNNLLSNKKLDNFKQP